jgi:hypothetical protein
LPSFNPVSDYHVTIRLDGHSSQHHTDELRKRVESLPNSFYLPRLAINVQFVNSKRFVRLQLCDLLMGAAGSHGNKMHLRREGGRRGMTKKQKWRFEMACYIYNHFRQLDASERGSKAFNWFESTSTDGDVENRLKQKLSIWKFQPKHYRRDAGWQNKNLDSHGLYVGPIIDPMVHEAR